MKTKIIVSILGFLFTGFFSKNLFAQIEKAEVIIKEVAPSKTDKETQEIIIRKKGNKDTKVTLEITDGKVLINGKPMVEFKEDGLTINNRKIIIKEGNKITMNLNEEALGKLEILDDIDMNDIENITIDKIGGMDFNSFGEAETSKPFLGVVTEKNNDGAKIMSVEKESPAEKAGLQKGDVIKKLDLQKINSYSELSGYISTKRPNDKVQVTYIRDGQTKTAQVTLIKNDVFTTEFKGLELENIESSDKKKFKIDYGVRIKEINNENLKPYSNQLKGNIILSIDNVKATDVETVSRLLNKKDENENISIQMINGVGQLMQIIL